MRVLPNPVTTWKGVLCSDREPDANDRELERLGLYSVKHWRRLSQEVMARSGIFEVSGPPPSGYASSSVVVAKEVDQGQVEYWAYFDDGWVKLSAW